MVHGTRIRELVHAVAVRAALADHLLGHLDAAPIAKLALVRAASHRAEYLVLEAHGALLFSRADLGEGEARPSASR